MNEIAKKYTCIVIFDIALGDGEFIELCDFSCKGTMEVLKETNVKLHVAEKWSNQTGKKTTGHKYFLETLLLNREVSKGVQKK